MKRIFFSLGLGLGLIAAISITGCGGSTQDDRPPFDEASADGGHDDHDHEGHDHDHEGHDHDHEGHDHEGHDHEGHDHSAHEHPEHGLNGGHMVGLDDGSEIEVALDKEKDAFAIFPASPEKVTAVKMITKIEGSETTYDFAASDAAETAGAFLLVSPELATAVRMGDVAEVTLVVESDAGKASTKYVHHEH